MGTENKDRNSGLKKQGIKKRCQIHRTTMQRIFNDSDNHSGVITDLEPNNLESRSPKSVHRNIDKTSGVIDSS